MSIPYLGPARHRSAGNNLPIRRIVIHSTVGPSKAGSARQIATYFRSSRAGGSAQYVVDAGEVVQCLADNVIAWHAPPNQHSIGVEMCDYPSQDVKRWNSADHEAVLRRTAGLVGDLCDKYDVPRRRLSADQVRDGEHGICGHVDVSHAFHQSTHWDPGAFPWDTFMDLLTAHPAPPPEEDPMAAFTQKDLEAAAKAGALAALNSLRFEDPDQPGSKLSLPTAMRRLLSNGKPSA